jgi:hypothetical protein
MSKGTGMVHRIAVRSELSKSVSRGDSSEDGSTGQIVQHLLVGALAALALIKNHLRRETVEPPKWLGTLQSADSKCATGENKHKP